MTRSSKALATLAIAAGMGALLTGAARPALLARAGGGLWEIDRVGPGARARICVPDAAVLASYEHRGKPCTRVVISETANSALVHYTCTGGGFGRSQVTQITPRSFRVETQGIADNAPFQYVFQARRMGDCR